MGELNNVKIILENDDHKKMFCIISKNHTRQEEFEKVLSVRKGYGFSVDCYDDCIKLKDYFAGETRATFKIIKEEDTNEVTQYHFIELEE